MRRQDDPNGRNRAHEICPERLVLLGKVEPLLSEPPTTEVFLETPATIPVDVDLR